jgi:hypothetical protein
MLEKAKEKLKLEMEQNKDNGYVQFIGQSLLDRLSDMPGEAEAILTEGKTIAKSLDAMAAEAKKKPRIGNCAMLTPDEGIKVVLHYFGIHDIRSMSPAPGGPADKFDIKLEDLLL